MKKILYNFGCLLGGGLLFLCPIIERITTRSLSLGKIQFASIGSLILGLTLLIDYLSYHGDAEQYKNWWKQIAGIFFIVLFISDLLPLSAQIKSVTNIIIYGAFLAILYFRYNQLKG